MSNSNNTGNISNLGNLSNIGNISNRGNFSYIVNISNACNFSNIGNVSNAGDFSNTGNVSNGVDFSYIITISNACNFSNIGNVSNVDNFSNIGNTSKAGLKKLFVCRHPTLGLRVYFGEGQSRSQGLTAFWLSKKNDWEKERLPATVVIIDSDKVQVNQRNKGIRFNYTFCFISNQVARGLTLKMV